MLSDLKMNIRRHMPEKAKRTLRGISLAMKTPPPPAPELPQTALNNCRFLTNRDEMLKHLPQNAQCIEVGTLYGNYAHTILEETKPQSLLLIDLNFSELREDVRNHPNVELREGQSPDILKSLKDSTYDWIYIDGDHTYEGVKKDIEAAKTKLKPGGYLVFNDFCRISGNGLGTFGVHQAVCEFVVKEQWDVAYFCFQRHALYDIALQKPKTDGE